MDYTDPLSYTLILESSDEGRMLRKRLDGYTPIHEALAEAARWYAMRQNTVSIVSSHYGDGRYGFTGRIETLRWYMQNGAVFEIDGSGVPAGRGAVSNYAEVPQ